jgi:hypothetical protein
MTLERLYQASKLCLDANGNPLDEGSVKVLIHDQTVRADIYSDSDGSEMSNPWPLRLGGRFDCFVDIDLGYHYDVIVYDKMGNPVDQDLDIIPGGYVDPMQMAAMMDQFTIVGDGRDPSAGGDLFHVVSENIADGSTILASYNKLGVNAEAIADGESILSTEGKLGVGVDWLAEMVKSYSPLKDAPADGKEYVRKDEEWVENSGGAGGIEDIVNFAGTSYLNTITNIATLPSYSLGTPGLMTDEMAEQIGKVKDVQDYQGRSYLDTTTGIATLEAFDTLYKTPGLFDISTYNMIQGDINKASQWSRATIKFELDVLDNLRIYMRKTASEQIIKQNTEYMGVCALTILNKNKNYQIVFQYVGLDNASTDGGKLTYWMTEGGYQGLLPQNNPVIFQNTVNVSTSTGAYYVIPEWKAFVSSIGADSALVNFSSYIVRGVGAAGGGTVYMGETMNGSGTQSDPYEVDYSKIPDDSTIKLVNGKLEAQADVLSQGVAADIADGTTIEEAGGKLSVNETWLETQIEAALPTRQSLTVNVGTQEPVVYNTAVAKTLDLAEVAGSGSYEDLLDQPKNLAPIAVRQTTAGTTLGQLTQTNPDDDNTLITVAQMNAAIQTAVGNVPVMTDVMLYNRLKQMLYAGQGLSVILDEANMKIGYQNIGLPPEVLPPVLTVNIDSVTGVTGTVRAILRKASTGISSERSFLASAVPTSVAFTVESGVDYELTFAATNKTSSFLANFNLSSDQTTNAAPEFTDMPGHILQLTNPNSSAETVIIRLTSSINGNNREADVILNDSKIGTYFGDTRTEDFTATLSPGDNILKIVPTGYDNGWCYGLTFGDVPYLTKVIKLDMMGYARVVSTSGDPQYDIRETWWYTEEGSTYYVRGTFEGCDKLVEVADIVIPENTVYYSGGGSTPRGSLMQMFKDCVSLVQTPNFVFPDTAISVGPYLFALMFSGCTSLTQPQDFTAPKSKSYGRDLFGSMFAGCTGITKAPQLIIPDNTGITLGNYAYIMCFDNCSSLTTPAPIILPAGITLGTETFNGMYGNCSALETLPVITIPSATYGQSTFVGMFINDSLLKDVTTRAIPVSAKNETTNFGGSVWYRTGYRNTAGNRPLFEDGTECTLGF